MSDKVVKALEQAQRDRSLWVVPRPAGWAPAVNTAPANPPEMPHVAPLPAPSVRLLKPVPGGIDGHLVSLLDPVSAGAEQYRTLRYLVEQAHRVDQVSILAVSAPTVGDGKTTTAINLAGALAQASEARVVLIDADLRRPSLHRSLGLGEARRGLVDVILDPGMALADVIQSCSPFNLSVVPAGATTASPYELLKSPRLAEVFEEARRQFDYVVVDTPPLIPVPDCRIIGKHVDGFLLVVRAHRTRTKLFDEAARVLDASKIVGLIFNASDEASHDRYAAPYVPDGADEAEPTKGVAWRRRFFGVRRDRRHRQTASR